MVSARQQTKIMKWSTGYMTHDYVERTTEQKVADLERRRIFALQTLANIEKEMSELRQKQIEKV